MFIFKYQISVPVKALNKQNKSLRKNFNCQNHFIKKDTANRGFEGDQGVK